MRAIINFFKKIFNFITSVIVGIIFVLTLLFLICSFAMKNGDGTFSLFGYEGRIILSGSMEPTLRVNSLVILDTNANKDTLQIGDIVTFNEDGFINGSTETITHRIIGIETYHDTIYYTLKGDAIKNDTQYIPSSFVVGKVVADNYPLGCFLQFIDSKLGILFLIVAPSLIISIAEFVRIIKLILEDDEDSNENKFIPYNPYDGGFY